MCSFRYILGRLLNRNGERGAPNAEETNSIHHNMAAARPPTDMFDPSVYAKKSQHYTGYKTLKKFGGSGSRNCFFTPIQCMIEHDLGTYKKMVDSSIKMSGVYTR